MSLNILLNPNEEKTLKIIKAIYKNDGYCPCRIIKNEDSKCPCLEMLTNHKCHCGLFVNDNSNN